MRAKYMHVACVLICMLFLLCGCKNEKESIASDSWQFNDAEHWHLCDSADCTQQHDIDSHQWDTGVIKQEATCEQIGQKVFTCTVCNATRTEEIVCTPHTPAEEWKHDYSAHWYICQGCGKDYSQAVHKWYQATTSENGDASEELYVCVICNLFTDEKPAVLEDPNAKPIYVGKIPSNIPTLGNGEYVFIPHMNGNNFTIESSIKANIGVSRGEKTPFGKSVMIDVPVGAGLLTLKPDSIMSREDVEKLVAEGNSEIVASFSIEITGGKWWGGPVKISTPWSGLSYSTDKYSENKASLTVKFSAADFLANYDRICEEGLFVLDYANRYYDSYRFTMTPFEIKDDHEFGDKWEQDENDHYHVCKVCGMEMDREGHILTGKVCSVCGEVKDFLFKPRTDGSNFKVSNAGNVSINVFRGETELGSVAVIDVPQNAGVITFTPNEILDKAKLEALQAEGITEVKAQLTTRITGGKWWPGSVKISASWTGKEYTFAASEFKNNLLGPVTIKFSLKDALDNYDQICNEGLFSFYFDNQVYDTYQISFSSFELVTEHEWPEVWQQDIVYHYRLCSICEAEDDRAEHEMVNDNICAVCGEVKCYLFDPKTDGSNFRVTNTGNVNIKVFRGETELGTVAVIDVPQGAKTITFTPDSILDKAMLEKLYAEGYTEIRAKFTMRITGGKWWGGTAKITAGWTSKSYTYAPSEFKDNLLGPVTLIFNVQDALNNYDKICQNGLFNFYFDNQGYDTYRISFNGFELIADHQWVEGWSWDDSHHFIACSHCDFKKDKTEHSWEEMPGGQKCTICGYEEIISFIVNDLSDPTGIKMTYQNPGGILAESTFDNSGIVMDGQALKINIPMWIKSQSLQFYLPLQLTKIQVKKLLAAGCTEFTVTVQQSQMNQASNSTLTNTISADWTSVTYDVTSADGFKVLKFSLQDLYDNYDALANGSMAFLRFGIAELGAEHGGIMIPGQGMVSTDYDIWIKDLNVIPVNP